MGPKGPWITDGAFGPPDHYFSSLGSCHSVVWQRLRTLLHSINTQQSCGSKYNIFMSDIFSDPMSHNVCKINYSVSYNLRHIMDPN